MPRTGLPTMVDVAADAGVSLKTVSRVINGEPNVAPELAARVNESIIRLGYQRNVLAANLRSGSRDTIGFIAADLSNGFYTQIAAAISSVALAHGIQVIMASHEEDPETERTLALDMSHRRVAGLVVVPTSADHGYLAGEVARGTPVVFLDRPGVGITADQVLLDNHSGARAAVTELLAAGHQRIGVLLDSLEIASIRERMDGVLDAFAASGRAAPPPIIIDDLHTPGQAREAAHRLLDSDQPPTALFCGNNRATVGALEAILPRESGVALSCFDDFELSRVLPRGIRVVDYDTAELGARAASTLLERIRNDPQTPVTTYRVPTRLVTRGSTRA